MEESLKKDFNLDFYLKYILAIGLVFMGIDKFIVFNPLFKFTGEAEILYNALDRAGFILPFVGTVEIIVGAFLIRKNTTPLGLIMLLPFSISIMLFHLIMAPSQIFPALFVFVLNIILIYRDRAIFSPIFHSITDGEDEVKQAIANMSWVKKDYDKNRS
jgi:hypothetical protein